MNKEEIRKKLIICFRKCAYERKMLRNCIVDIMDAGLKIQDVLDVADEITTEKLKNEVNLCAVTAIGQALRYEENHVDLKEIEMNKKTKNFIKKKLKICFKNCGMARLKLRKCVTDALNMGLSRENILAITDDIVGNFGKDEVSVCAIIAVEQVLRHKEINQLKNMLRLFAPYMKFSDEKIEV